MSSFVIGKKEYTKCAGFLAAAVETKDYYREPCLALWNIRERRQYTAEDVHADFCRLYAINADAVAKQYGDSAVEDDGRDYADVFAACKLHALPMIGDGMNHRGADAEGRLRLAIFNVIQFFRAIQYQIEDEANTTKALRILNKYYRGLYSILQAVDGITRDDVDSWGSFRVFDENLQEGM